MLAYYLLVSLHQETELGLLLRDSQGCSEGAGWAEFSTGGSIREDSAFKLIQIISLWLYD